MCNLLTPLHYTCTIPQAHPRSLGTPFLSLTHTHTSQGQVPHSGLRRPNHPHDAHLLKVHPIIVSTAPPCVSLPCCWRQLPLRQVHLPPPLHGADAPLWGHLRQGPALRSPHVQRRVPRGTVPSLRRGRDGVLSLRESDQAAPVQRLPAVQLQVQEGQVLWAARVQSGVSRRGVPTVPRGERCEHCDWLYTAAVAPRWLPHSRSSRDAL